MLTAKEARANKTQNYLAYFNDVEKLIAESSISEDHCEWWVEHKDWDTVLDVKGYLEGLGYAVTLDYEYMYINWKLGE